MLKYLRIAVTALSLTACVLLIALWVRSYWWWDHALSPNRQFHSASGRILYDVFDGPLSMMRGEIGWRINSRPITHWPGGKPGQNVELSRLLGIGYKTVGGSLSAVAPHWFLVLLLATAAALPWIRWRFSLRTLLIATTLVAVALGIIVVSR